jgi:ribosomal protein L17
MSLRLIAHMWRKSSRPARADADKRVSDVINQAKTDLDNARRAAAKLSLWLTASLLIGAFCASLAATEGGHVRVIGTLV